MTNLFSMLHLVSENDRLQDNEDVSAVARLRRACAGDEFHKFFDGLGLGSLNNIHSVAEGFNDRFFHYLLQQELERQGTALRVIQYTGVHPCSTC